MSPCLEKLRRLALAEVESTVAALPGVLREQAQRLPLTFERRPSRAVQADGIASDTLGLFVGPTHAEDGSATWPIPSQIILYLYNLWDFAEGDVTIFQEEVRTTYLHELGHYLGLDEDDLSERGLE